jgi:hypothetical protein
MGAGVTLRNNHNSTGEDATAYPHGGGVHVNGGRFEMTGGTISGNEASIGGGGVFVTNNGMFTMSGNSTISGNAAKSGGGVLAYNGTFEMSGGEISNNDGGGVLLALGGTFKMSGTAVISNNTAITSGSGVYVDGNATFKMGGGAVVKQEVYLAHGSSSPAKITVTGTLKPPSGEKYSAKIGLGPIDDNPVVLVSEGYSLTATDIEKFEPLNDGAFLVYNNYQGILARPKGTDNAFYVNSGGTLQSASTLKDAITDVFGGTADDPAPIYVANNVTLTETIGIDGKHIKLTVLGTEKKTIVRGSSFSSGSLFTIPSGGSLTLDAGDSTLTLDGNKNNNNGNENQLPLVTVTGGTLTMSEGVTLQNNNNAFVQCGGVLVSSGIFNMRGGTIAYMYGSGVWVSSGATFKMTGGTISNNVASNRDGVYVDSSSSTFEMEGKGVVSGMVYLHGTGGQDYGKITVTGKLELPEDTLVQIYMDTQPSPRVVLTGTPDYNLIQDDVNKFQVVYPNDKSLELNTDDNKAVLSQ